MFGRAFAIVGFIVAVLLVTILPVAVWAHFFEWNAAGLFMWALFSCVIVTSIAVQLLSSSGYVLKEKSLNVLNSGVRTHILFQSIVRVDHVRNRRRSHVEEGVHVVYRQGTAEKEVHLKPENPALFVHDLLQRCPHLTSYQEHKAPHLSVEDAGAESGNKLSLICA